MRAMPPAHLQEDSYSIAFIAETFYSNKVYVQGGTREIARVRVRAAHMTRAVVPVQDSLRVMVIMCAG